MRKILITAGIGESELKLIPQIVQTCRVCRAWTRPLPANVSSVDFADRFNKRVEVDLMFIYDYVVLCIIDVSIRWWAACIIPDKSQESIIDGIDSIWVSPHGPHKNL
jgi:hypothetical protein